jgi:hypothetical protein
LPFSASYFFTVVFCFFIAIVALQIFTYRRRLRFIDAYVWPPGLIAKLQGQHPTLSAAQIDRIGLGLKQFFRAYHRGGYRPVAMPSQAADDLWHEFILYTKAYDAFCRQAFGRFLHHTPAAVLAPGLKKSNEGLRRVWWQACKEETIDPRAPAALPLLFALDADLKIPNGYRYVPDCGSVRTVSVGVEYSRTQCGGDFSATSYDGTTDGLGDGDGGGGDGDGGGGCGGD